MGPPPLSFDVVAKYKSLTASDPSLTPPIAAIETLLALLASAPATTISETLALIQSASTTLHQKLPNNIALTAGTDLFQRYVVTILQRPGALSSDHDFSQLHKHLISNSKVFVQRAKQARIKIAVNFLPFFSTSQPTTLVSFGPSRTIATLLSHAILTNPSLNISHIAILPSQPILHAETLSLFKDINIPTSFINAESTAYALSTIPPPYKTLIVCGANSVLENGGIVARIGTYQLALLAKALTRPFYVATESYNFVRLYPLNQVDLPVRQDVVDFDDGTEVEGGNLESDDGEGEGERAMLSEDDKVDYTPPELITALVTENGAMTPNAVSEELIKLWF